MTSNNGSNPLTDRQLELVGLVASGLTIEQAAKRCFIAQQSAYNILSSARARAGAETMAQLAVVAVVNGWLEADDEGEYIPAASLQAV
jgi:DNA-binding CsgD family transcriptional regulator